MRIEKLILSGQMTEFGLSKIEDALGKNEQARKFFLQLKPTFQKQFILWIITAKRPETKDKRIKEFIEILKNGQQLGLR